jgi:hypothetical protein
MLDFITQEEHYDGKGINRNNIIKEKG